MDEIAEATPETESRRSARPARADRIATIRGRTMNKFIRRIAPAHGLALPLVLTLAACGGSDDATPPPPPVVEVLKVTGTAAIGAPMANASIQIACSAGTATATADANGVYTVTITDGALPCVITATSR